MTATEWKARLAHGNAFDDADVARSYAHRPPYAPAALAKLLDLTPHKDQLVDLGCGPGKVAADLAPHFAHTLALDPAAAMIAEAKRLHPAANITWLHASAEDAALPDHIDLVTAGTALHWTQHDVLFPKLAARTSLLAVLNIENLPGAPWHDAYRAVMTTWLARIDQVYDPVAFQKKTHAYEAWIDIAGRETFIVPFSQPVEDFIDTLHSSATFSRTRMRTALATAFDRDLHTALTPHANGGTLTFDTATTLVWGAPRRYAQGTET